MARYINKDEFIAKIQDNFCTECNNYDGVKCKSCGIDDTIDMVENADEADVVPKSEVESVLDEIEKTIRAALILIDFSYKHNQKEIQCRKECYEDFLGYIAELKKKYTEG
jgi:hypothetical protein